MQPTVISSQAEGSFALQEMPAGTTPGIQRNETESEIDVTYQSRFTLFDEVEQVPRSVLQTKNIKTQKAVPNLGVMLVGLGGNNGSTFVAGIMANKRNLEWRTRNGV